MNYKPFYSLIRQLANGKISRRLFVIGWVLLQKAQAAERGETKQ